jgi:para-aminobenzoate synthetase component I
VHRINITADELVSCLLFLAEDEDVWLLDSCGVAHLGSHLLIAGLRPSRTIEITDNAAEAIEALDSAASSEHASIFTLSYEFGAELLGIRPLRPKSQFPDVIIAQFLMLVIHDYNSGETTLVGDDEAAQAFASTIESTKTLAINHDRSAEELLNKAGTDLPRDEYIRKIELIKEFIRRGDTYQTNLCQQLSVHLEDGSTPQKIFKGLRDQHPAPFSAFIRQGEKTVVSASPERFFRIDGDRITTSPIKGTRRRDPDPMIDEKLRRELLESEKDRAENTMIVDLLRNDLGRVCEYGTVNVEKLCELEEHPTLFHLVSTISGRLRHEVRFSDIVTALFPCGSITGAPKIRTMEIIEELEPTPRGLSMGSIGICLPPGFVSNDRVIDSSVAIRTMVIEDDIATLKVGGGIVIESDPAKEYEESLLKASALLRALNATFDRKGPPSD